MSYEEKYISVEKALSFVKSNDFIVTGLGAAEAGLFMENLHTIADRVKNVTISNCLPTHPSKIYDPEYVDSFNVDGWFFAPQLRKAAGNGNMAYIPNHLHLAATKRMYFRHCNIYVGAASMPDKFGYISLSLSNTYERRFIDDADLVILEVNPNFPYTLGDVQIHVDEVDYLIKADYMPPETPEGTFNERDEAIGKLIADMVPDGSCIQLGIGAIPDATGMALKEKHDLGIHTEMFTDSMVELIACGAVNNSRKQIHRGVSVTTFAFGSQRIYDYIDNNPAIALMPVDYVNDPNVICQNDNMISINAALEVDFWGQVCAESVGTKHMSGSGGQIDYVRGATQSKGGKSFIAFSSTAKGGTISKIKSTLTPGAVCTTSKNDVDYIVTEYGVAHLRGESLASRTRQLIAIAHPDFRDQLSFEAKQRGIMI